MRLLRFAGFLLALVTSAVAAEIKVATLNCLLLFDPRINHSGSVDEQEQMTLEQYNAKLANLASLANGFDVVGLQETGGKAEIAALANSANMHWAWERGTDTATGQEVGLMYRLPGWSVTSRGRVRELDRVISKHLFVEAKTSTARVLFLVVHLVRPIGNQAAKQKGQLEAVGRWMTAQAAAHPSAVVVVLGDTNSTLTAPGSSVYGVGIEAGELLNWRSTHLTNKPFDRLALLGPGKWRDVQIRKPPFGNRPAAAVRRVWTDHYLFGATLVVP